RLPACGPATNVPAPLGDRSFPRDPEARREPAGNGAPAPTSARPGIRLGAGRVPAGREPVPLPGRRAFYGQPRDYRPEAVATDRRAAAGRGGHRGAGLLPPRPGVHEPGDPPRRRRGAEGGPPPLAVAVGIREPA